MVEGWLNVKIAPIIGILFTLPTSVSLGLTYRGQLDAVTEGPYNATISWGDIPLLLVEDVVYQYSFFTPQQLSLGISKTFLSSTLISIDLAWLDWSRFKDTQGRKPEPAFNDTYIPRIGCEIRLKRGMKIMTGYYYERSPVPPQRGESNFVDTNKHVFSMGLGIDFDRLHRSFKTPIEIDIHLQHHMLSKRHTAKDPALLMDEDPSIEGLQSSNPGLRGYTAGGYLLNIGLSISYKF